MPLVFFTLTLPTSNIENPACMTLQREEREEEEEEETRDVRDNSIIMKEEDHREYSPDLINDDLQKTPAEHIQSQMTSPA